jgi:hypothetical protein
MPTLTIVLTEDQLQKLEDMARRYHVAPEDLVRVKIEELLARPEEEFRKARDRHLAWLEHAPDLGTGGVIREARDAQHER